MLESLFNKVAGLQVICILNSSKQRSRGSATMSGDESLHPKSTLLRAWGSEFGIPNRYTGFKIALDTALG